MVHASDLTYFYSSQPSSSQFRRDEEAVERAFWQSTPIPLEEPRQGKRMRATKQDHDRPNDPLSLSTQQSRLIRQTWASAAGSSIDRDGEAQTSSRPKYRNRRGRAATPENSTNITTTSTTSTVSSSTDTDKSIFFFGHLKNIEKVSKTVDERMQKRKIQKEWSSKVISETARLRDSDEEGGRLKENMNTDENVMHEAFDEDGDNDLLGLGTPQPDDYREPESMMEEVPTSQSQERYLSLSHLSQISPTEYLGASCAPINGPTATN
ncbi:hypothetical protein BGY98DRAFT_957300 [Russula aff. rugulosa BPL654]|nr:hypothetical protein BGY98DRAFT_957300 [Russula aff. rugulosa BPL654]